MIVEGYKTTTFEHKNVTIRLKIPDFQLNAIFEMEQLASPIIIDKIYPAFLGVHLEINNSVFSLQLPLSHQNFECNEPDYEYLIAWWEWYKPQRANELKQNIKRGLETVTSIIKNEESIFLSVKPLSKYLESSKYTTKMSIKPTKSFDNEPYQDYRKEVHNIVNYGKRDEYFDVDLLKVTKSKYAAYPRLWRDSTGTQSKNNKPTHAFFYYGTHTESFKQNWTNKMVARCVAEQISDPINSIGYKAKKNEIIKSVNNNYQEYYSTLPITLIVDTIIID